MKMQAVRAFGKGLGLTFPVGTTKKEAIRAIQLAEGNFDCFGRAEHRYCDQEGCLFRGECFRVSGKTVLSPVAGAEPRTQRAPA